MQTTSMTKNYGVDHKSLQPSRMRNVLFSFLYALIIAATATAFSVANASTILRAGTASNIVLGPDGQERVSSEVDPSVSILTTYDTATDKQKLEAKASYGSLGVYADGSTKRGNTGFNYGASSASFRVEDLVFTSADSDPIDVLLRLDIDGLTKVYGSVAYIHTVGRLELFGGIGMSEFVGFPAGGTDGSSNSGRITYNANNESSPWVNGIFSDLSLSQETIGVWEEGSVDDAVYVLQQDVPVNVPVSLEVAVKAYVGTASNHSSRGSVDFLNTVSLPTGFDVFQYYDQDGGALSGINANSLTANIVDNQWTSVAAVPVPGSFLLLASGLAGLAGISARSRRR